MFTLKKILVAMFTLVAVSSTFAGDKDKSETEQRVQRLFAIVKDALHGKNLDQVQKRIADDAYFVDGAFFSSLREVLSDEKISSRLNEENTRQAAFMQAHIADDGSAGYLFLKTESAGKAEPRFHTVNFVKAKDGEFYIKDWHASH